MSRARIGPFSFHVYNRREYIQVPLIESLIIGQTYRVKIHVKIQYLYSIAVNQIGALFTEERLTMYDLFPYYGNYPEDSTNSIMIEHYPQVKCDSIFTAQEDYGVIEGLFTADKAYTYMSIGVFTPDEKLNYQYLNSEDIEATSLIIDDVSVEAVTVGLDEGMESKIELYPNPASTRVHIESPYAISLWKVLDAVGKEVASSKYLVSSKNLVLDVSSLDAGLYFLELELDGEKVVKQLIVE